MEILKGYLKVGHIVNIKDYNQERKKMLLLYENAFIKSV